MSGLIGIVRKRAAMSKDITPLVLTGVMITAVTIFMLAHTVEVFVWSLLYRILGVVNSDVVYFAFVNYTTLGYGDILPAPQWRLLGPLAAMNGILLFGWSTAVIFEILRRTLIRMDEIAPHP